MALNGARQLTALGQRFGLESPAPLEDLANAIPDGATVFASPDLAGTHQEGASLRARRAFRRTGSAANITIPSGSEVSVAIGERPPGAATANVVVTGQ